MSRSHSPINPTTAGGFGNSTSGGGSGNYVPPLTYFVASGAYVLKSKTIPRQSYDDLVAEANSNNNSGSTLGSSQLLLVGANSNKDSDLSNKKQWQWKRKYLWVEGDCLYLADAPAEPPQAVALRLCRRAERVPRHIASRWHIPDDLTPQPCPAGQTRNSDGTLIPQTAEHCWIIRTADKVLCFQSADDDEAGEWVSGLTAAFPATRMIGNGCGRTSPMPMSARRNTTSTAASSNTTSGYNTNTTTPTTGHLMSAATVEVSPIGSNAGNNNGVARNRAQSSTSNPRHSPLQNNTNNGALGIGRQSTGDDPLAADESMPNFSQHQQVANTSFGNYVATTNSGGGVGGLGGGNVFDSDDDDDTHSYVSDFGAGQQQHGGGARLSGGGGGNRDYIMRNTFYFRNPADAAYLRGGGNTNDTDGLATPSSFHEGGNNGGVYRTRSSGGATFGHQHQHPYSNNTQPPSAASSLTAGRTESTLNHTYNNGYGSMYNNNSSIATNNHDAEVNASTLRKRAQTFAFTSAAGGGSGARSGSQPSNYNNNFDHSGSSALTSLERAQDAERDTFLNRNSKPTKFGYIGDSAHARAAADDAIATCRVGMMMLKGRSGKQKGTGTLLDEAAEEEREALNMTNNGSFGGNEGTSFANNSLSTATTVGTATSFATNATAGGGAGPSSGAGATSDPNTKIGGGSNWKKKYLWIDGRTVCYGSKQGGKSQPETTFYIDEVRDAYRFAYHEMERLKAPEANRRFGWCMRLKNGRIVNFGGDSDAQVNAWVIALNYLRPETMEEVHAREQLEHEKMLIEEERRRAWEARMAALKAQEERRKEEEKRKKEAAEQKKMQDLIACMLEAQRMMDEKIRKEREEKAAREEEERVAAMSRHASNTNMNNNPTAPSGAVSNTSLHNADGTVNLREEQRRRELQLELEHEQQMAAYLEECHKPLSPQGDGQQRKERQGCCSVM